MIMVGSIWRLVLRFGVSYIENGFWFPSLGGHLESSKTCDVDMSPQSNALSLRALRASMTQQMPRSSA